MRFKFIKSILNFLIVLVLVTANSIAGEVLHGPVQGQANIASNKVSIIVYREKSDDTKNTPVVFIDDHVAASLLPGEYIQTRVCNSKIQLRIATRGEIVAKGQVQSIKIFKDTITYIKMIKTKDQTFVPLVVDKIQGQKELQKIQTTSNIINRYIPKIVLGADSLFAFDSTKLLPSARETMDKLVYDINMCPNQVNHIKITGHTDRIGSDAYNNSLSLRRAQAIADYLSEHSVDVSMDVEGRGSKEPVTTNCKGKLSPELIQCLQPDRRAEIDY